MKNVLALFFTAILAMAFVHPAFARGGFSSGGGRGGFSSGRSYSAPMRSYSSGTVTHTTINRSYYGGGGYHGGYGGGGMGGFATGALTGYIVGNMMHPQGTVVYQGGGAPGGALMYPNGMVVDPDTGYQVGMVQNGQYMPVQGGMVAQQVPQDYQPPPAYGPQQQSGTPWGKIIFAVALILVIVFIIRRF